MKLCHVGCESRGNSFPANVGSAGCPNNICASLDNVSDGYVGFSAIDIGMSYGCCGNESKENEEDNVQSPSPYENSCRVPVGRGCIWVLDIKGVDGEVVGEVDRCVAQVSGGDVDDGFSDTR